MTWKQILENATWQSNEPDSEPYVYSDRDILVAILTKLAEIEEKEEEE